MENSKINYEEFKKLLEERLKDYFPQEYQAEISLFDKINRKVEGLTFKGEKFKDYSPVIYVEDLYKAYEETNDLDNILKDMKDMIMHELEHKPNIDSIMNKEFVKQNVIFQLINTEQNKDKLEQLPHREFMDLSIVYKLIIQINDNDIEDGFIYNYLAEELGFSEQDLFELAKKNTTRIFPLVVQDLGELIGIIPQEMYVITNTVSRNGSYSMLYDNNLSLIAKELNSDLYIIPSSIHEVIAVKANGRADLVTEMINEINSNSKLMQKEEILSNQTYFYNKMFHSISTTKGDNIITETLINSPTKKKKRIIR